VLRFSLKEFLVKADPNAMVSPEFYKKSLELIRGAFNG
jgi:hypothetical protein